MKINNFLFYRLLIIAPFLAGCLSAPKETTNKEKKIAVVNDHIEKLLDRHNPEDAQKYLDSLIKTDKSNGFYYYKLGEVDMYNRAFADAVHCFEIAEQLHYNKKKCEFMISLNQNMINDNIRFKDTTSNTVH